MYFKKSVFLFFISISLWAQWEKSITPYSGNINEFKCIGNNIYAATEEGGILQFNGNGTSWQQINSGLNNLSIRSISQLNAGLFACTLGGIYLSEDGGNSWTSSSIGLNTSNISSVVESSNLIFCSAWSDGIYKSTNGGKNWIKQTNNPASVLINKLVINDNILYASTWGGGINKSTDNGGTWSFISNSISSLFINTVAFNNNYIYAGIWNSGLYMSSDGGTTWKKSAEGLTSSTVYDFEFYDNNIIVGTGAGVFLSTNNGNNWTSINGGGVSHYTDIFSVKIYGNYLFAGGIQETGIWRRPLSDIITDIAENNKPILDFDLSQNYPNPFNPNTTISYQIPKAGKVSLKVYDILGKEVAVLVEEYKEIGKYIVNFNGSNLASGIYMYKLEAGNFVSTKKLVLMK